MIDGRVVNLVLSNVFADNTRQLLLLVATWLESFSNDRK